MPCTIGKTIHSRPGSSSSSEDGTNSQRLLLSWKEPLKLVSQRLKMKSRNIILLAFWVVLVTTSTISAQDVGSTYAANCANCHGADGRGNTALGRTLKLHDLRSPEVQRLSEDELVVILSKGADRGRMPGFEKKLGADTVHRLVAYVREIDAQPIPAASNRKTAHSKTEPADVTSVFLAKCAHCHGADGSGDTVLGRTLKLRDMRSAEAQKFSDNEMNEIIASGTDRGRMPGFRKKLAPEMVEQLASYVRLLAAKPPVNLTKDTVTVGAVSKPAVSQPINPNAQIENKAILNSPPERLAQPTEAEKAVAAQKALPIPKSSPVIPNRKSAPPTLPVDLNSASKEILMTLPGINEADAANIIAGRPYRSSLQFKTRNIVNAATYAKIAGLVVARKPAPKTQPSDKKEDKQ
jgi:mono/diheme cytochrome c family protein/DNA uptake protein ComE-like DNA-binding protein